MLVPYDTDAYREHTPYVTVGLIVLNIVIFAYTASRPLDVEAIKNDPRIQQLQVDVEEGRIDAEEALKRSFAIVFPYNLTFGDGLHPVQWITAHFLHASLGHVLGNMVFLWAFGLVVEGRLGPWKFILVYLGVGIVASFIEQVIMLGRFGSALGASDTIYGLLVIALVWSPHNVIRCFYWIWVFQGTWDLPIWGFSLFYLGWQVLFLILREYQMSSELLHLIGAGVGLGVGLGMLKLGMVECHGSDIVSYFTGKSRMVEQESFDAVAMREKVSMLRGGAPTRENAPPPKAPFNTQPVLDRIRADLVDGNALDAWNRYQQALAQAPSWVLPEPTLINLITTLQQGKHWPEATEACKLYLKHYQAQQAGVRLALASMLLVHEQRPRQARAVLKKLPQVTPAQAKRRDELLVHVQKQIDDGELEGPTEDW